MALTPLPPAPLISDSKTVFNEKASPFVQALGPMVNEINAVLDEIDGVGAGLQKVLRTPEDIPTLPNAAGRSNRILGFNAGGDPVVHTDSSVRALLNVADGATANATNAQLRDRATHTGTQAISTVTGLQSVLDYKLDDAQLKTNLASPDNSSVPSTLAVANAIADSMAGETPRGAWNASTNTPALASSVGTVGYWYEVSVAGTTNLNGETGWQVGDKAIFNGIIWTRIPASAVRSVDGRTGAVILNYDTPAQSAPASLPAGAKYSTKGANAVGDGGQGDFIVQIASGTPDGYSRVLLANGNHGVLQPPYNARQFGALGLGADYTYNLQLFANHRAGKKMYIPDGLYLVNQSVLIHSGTHVIGGGFNTKILANAAAWVGENRYPYSRVDAVYTNALFRNSNWITPGTPRDSGITIEGVSFDYNNIRVTNGGTHCVNFRYCDDIIVKGCYFYRAEDGAAFLGCNGTLTTECFAVDIRNCAYDHWDSPRNATVSKCFAVSDVETVQFVNFNPEPSGDESIGHVAESCVVSDSHFKYGIAAGSWAQIEPLANGNTVKNVIFSNCTFYNISVSARRDTRNVVLSNCIFEYSPLNTQPAIKASAMESGVAPRDFLLHDCIIKNSNTSAGRWATIQLWVDNYIVHDCIVSGGEYYQALHTGDYIGVVHSNRFDPPSSGLAAINGTGGFPPWIEITAFQNGWESVGGVYPSVAYYIDDDYIVHLRGAVKSGTLGLSAFTMPVGVRAINTTRGLALSNAALGAFRVDSSSTGGGVVPVSGSTESFVLDGISFRVR